MNRKIGLSTLCILVLIWSGPSVAREDLTVLVRQIQPVVVTIRTFDMDDTALNIGSGFFIDGGGHLITNFHVLKGAYSAEVKTADGDVFPVISVIAADESVDLIKLKVDIPEDIVRWVGITETDPVIAERILVVGSPLGLEQTVSEGIISAIRQIPSGGTFFQLSAPISPGSSGSPVIDMEGRVVGVVSFLVQKGQNLNFAISGVSLRNLKGGGKEKTLPEWTYSVSEEQPMLAEELCRKGFNFNIEGKEKGAVIFYEDAAKNNPDDPTTWDELGHCYVGLNKHAEAIAAQKHAISIAPGDPVAHYNLGVTYSAMGLPQEAIAAYRKAISIDPGYVPALFNIAVIYSMLGEPEAAIDTHKALIGIDPDFAPSHYALGITYAGQGLHTEAILAYREVIRINPDYAPAYYNMGVAYGTLGSTEEEMDAYIQAIRSNPDFAPAHYNIGISYINEGNRAAALEQFKILRDIDEEVAERLLYNIYR